MDDGTVITVAEIDTHLIDPSPYQPRRSFDPEKIVELAANIRANGLIHSISVRPKGDRFELLAGERRLRAVWHLGWKTVRAEKRDVTDFEARRIVLSENVQRVDLTAIEEIEAFAQWIDVLMSEDEEYAAIDKPPIERLVWVLMKLDNERRRGGEEMSNRFIGQIDTAFGSLPRPVNWQSFYLNDLRPYLNMDEDVKELAVEHKLKKSQAKALQKVKDKAPEEFERIKDTGEASVRAGVVSLETVQIEEASSREIEDIAKRSQLELNFAVATPVFPARKFAILYADPPWRYEHFVSKSRRVERHYATMPLEDICTLPINEIATDDCVLFLWATSPKLAEAIEVIDSWGFRYRTCMVWVKDRIGMGYYARQKHELLLVAGKGSPPPPQTSNRPASVTEEAQELDEDILEQASEYVVGAPRMEHSKKPDVFYEIIEQMYPDQPKIELFARHEREGWKSWGYEANGGTANKDS